MNYSKLLLFLFCVTTYSQISFSQLNIQFVAEDPYPIIIPEWLGHSALTPLADKLGRDYMYVTANSLGVKIYETSAGLNLIQTIDPSVLSGDASTITQRDSLLYVGLGSIFGDTSVIGAMAILDVADPTNPQLLDVWTDPSTNPSVASGVGVVRVQGDYAYLGEMAEGLTILNISNPSAITFVSKLTPAITFPHPNNDQKKVNARGMWIVDSLVYLCYDAGGVRVINVSDVFNPVQIGEFSNPITILPPPTNWNLPRAYNNIVVEDTLAYVAVDYCGLEVWSISDPTNAQLLAHWNPVDCPLNGQWEQAPVHTNEMILQKECDLLFVSTGKSDMMVLDIADPLAPMAIDSFGTVLDSTGVWGIDITDENIYLAYVFVGDNPLIPPALEFVPFWGFWGGMKMLSYDNCGLGLQEEEAANIYVYPNPAKSEITLLGIDGEYNYQLVELTGKVVLSGSAQGKKTLQVDLLVSGMYIVTIDGESVRYRSTLVIE
jgi:hypothetical protein